MLTTTNSIKIVGNDGIPVTVECNITDGIGIHLVGLADAAVKETLLRVVTAMQSIGYHIPGKKIIINIAPSDIVKSGSGYDLSVLIAMVAASEQEVIPELDKWLIVGEVGLDASVREVPGCVQAVETAIEKGFKGVIIPEDNEAEVAELFANFIPVYGVTNVFEAIDVIKHMNNATAWEKFLEKEKKTVKNSRYWDEIIGNEYAKRALEITAAGRHNMLLAGAIGSGKSMLAHAMTEILPPMGINETIEVAKTYSVNGGGLQRCLVGGQRKRPFRAPHVSASMSAMFGGGTGDCIRPGEVSLASKGVLFLDEVNYMPKCVNETLAGVMQDKKITISRLRSKVEFPADFKLIASTELCPCGYYGEGDRCTCTPNQLKLWRSKLTMSPIYDRIDVQVMTRCPSKQEILASKKKNSEDANTVAARVERAWQIQAERYKDTDTKSNAGLTLREIESLGLLSDECKKLIDTLCERLSLSSRAMVPIVRIARTIADLAEEKDILPVHISEATALRFLDRREN